MTIKLHNTMTKTLEDFVPAVEGRVGMYVCGPTVYDDAHIGNARPVVVFDVLFRTLRAVYGSEKVVYARNITDVDDKINARAVASYPDLAANEAIRKLTTETEARFRADARALLCLDPTVEPRATDHIAEMQSMIERLVASGHAYVNGDEVLFSVPSMPDYGRLSGRDMSKNLAGARVAADEGKRDQADFVLWKASSPEEPGWDSPWGRGRPGWHIECSAMSARYLGETFDIHGGGIDLVFPHHENEIAQSTCAHGTQQMARYWMHNAFVMINGRKMAKSEGNFVTMNDLLRTEKFGGRRWRGEVLRLAILMTSYREPLDFTERRLAEAEHLLAGWPLVVDTDEPASPEFLDRLTDDLDTVGALRVLQGLASKAKTDAAALETFSASAALMGVGVRAPALTDAEHMAVARAVERRLILAEAKDWTGADAVRAELSSIGIVVADYKDPVTGARKSRWTVVDADLFELSRNPQ